MGLPTTYSVSQLFNLVKTFLVKTFDKDFKPKPLSKVPITENSTKKSPKGKHHKVFSFGDKTLKF